MRRSHFDDERDYSSDSDGGSQDYAISQTAPKEEAPRTATYGYDSSDDDSPPSPPRHGQRISGSGRPPKWSGPHTNGDSRYKNTVTDTGEDDLRDSSMSVDLTESEEWKILTDNDEEDKDIPIPPNEMESRRGQKPASAVEKSKKERAQQRRRRNRPPRGSSSTEGSTPRSSMTDASAMAALMAEKHPWRRRRPSMGEDPAPSPTYGAARQRHSARRPFFTSLEGADLTAPKSPEGAVESPGDDSSVASSRGSVISTSSDSSRSSISQAELDSGGDAELESDAEVDVPEAFQNLQLQQQHTNNDSFPLSFLDPNSMTSPYLDQGLLDTGLTRTEANRFALEHRILLRAILQLLAERDHVGVEADVDDPENTIKRGPLKKFSQGGVTGRPNWKVKYVEIRRGSFSYFEDSRTLETPGRKTIPLRTNMCQCRPLDSHNIKGAYGYVLELTVEDGPKRLWMANSEEERQVWIRAIRDATIGGDVDANSHLMDVTLYQDAIEKYMKAQSRLGRARTKKEYLSCLALLWNKSLRVPVPWVREHTGLVDGDPSSPSCKSSELISTPMATLVKSRVTDFWKRLSRESVSINGHLMRADRPHGTERIVGAFSRCILEYDCTSGVETNMTELQAIIHARNVLLTYYKSRSRDEAYYAIDSLCRNHNLVVCLPNKSDTQSPLHVQVYSAVDEGVAQEQEKCGWVTTRSRAPRRWKNRYCVVSEGVLNYYEHCFPRPHGLRGQLVLVGATLNRLSLEAENNMFVLEVVTRDNAQQRQLCFRNERDMMLWKEAIQQAINSCAAMGTPRDGIRKDPGTPNSVRQRKGTPKRIIKGASDMILKKLPQKKPSFDDMNSHEATVVASDSIKSDGTGTKQEPTVQVVVESSRYYKIVTADGAETWAMVRANYLHSFLLSGGSHGQVVKGDELVEMEFLEGGVGEDAFDRIFPRAVGA